jgi:molybdopterin synthase sulfur carrier subunit
VRERIGIAEEELEPPAAVATVADLVGWLKTRGEGYEAALAEPKAIRVALDQVHARPGDRLAGAREVALFPPMTGG